MKARIRLGFAVLLFMMVVLTVIGVIRVNAVSNSLATIGDVNSVKQRYAINFRGSVHDRAISLRDVTMVDSEEDLKIALDEIAKLSADYQKSAVLLDGMFAERADTGTEERSILGLIKETEARTLPLVRKVVELRQAGNLDQARDVMLREARPAFVEWLARINMFIDLQEKLNQTESAYARNVASGFQTLMLIMCLLALAVGTAVATLIVRMILRSLGGEPREASAVAQGIAAGNLAVSIDMDPKDRTSVLFSMKEMRDSLVRIVSEVRTGTDTIANASSQIASGNLELSSRTEQQASSLQETASSMDELTSTVKQNADNARQANQLAVSASDVAVKGGQVVSQVVDTMASINDSARKIVDIIGVIDGIAFQTNILALNAAVEAARAGEQGRGFAVVASEVRNLAQRSAAAAKEIKSLIGDSVEKVDAGSRLVTEAGSTMNEIVASVKRVTTIMADIMSASQEQSAGIEQVHRSISQMEQVTQQNAALVEEAASAAESLQEQAANLAAVVATFRLDGMASPRTLPPAQRRSPPGFKPMARAGAAALTAAPVRARLEKPVATVGDEWESF
ncbi:methyl-accepting chemotaxis protein [Noviherbaspirillum sp.]|uniref:methyl-accepting chemotaxis protein n=1 Tax=Noviherbaspirillum sp. TaxID=1926288 RepID=UPI002FE373F3